MTEPPRPPGDDPGGYKPSDPVSPPPPPSAPYSVPGEASDFGYAPPPGSQPPPSYEQPAAPYQPQPGPGYGAPGGYPPGPAGGFPPGPAGGFPPGPGYASNDDKTFALIAHFGGAVGAFISMGVLGFVGPLIAYLAKGQQSPAVRAHAVAALNFQLVWSIAAFLLLFVSWCLVFIPSVIVMAVQIIFGIIAGLKANEGQLYRYPASVSMIK